MLFDLKLGFACNNDCIHCVVANKRNYNNLSIPQINKIIETIPSESTVQITGGEPSIFAYLPDVLKMCKDRNLTTYIQSNGTGFADKDFLKKCKPYLDKVHIAIHSIDEKVHNSIVQQSGMYKKTLEGFYNLLDEDIPISTQTVLSKLNIESLYDTYKFIQATAPGTIMSATYPHMMGNAFTNRENICFRYIDYKDILQNVFKDFAKNIFTEAIPYCYIHPYVQDLYYSAEKSILDSRSRVGVDHSNGSHLHNYNLLDVKDKRKLPRCKECIYNNICLGVWKEYVDLFKNNIDLYPIKDHS